MRIIFRCLNHRLDANILRCESDQDIEAGIDSIEVSGLIISIDNYSDRLNSY